MSATPQTVADDWESIDDKAHKAMDAKRSEGVDADNVKGWRNAETGEAIVAQPLLGDNDDSLPAFGVYWYLKSGYSTVRKRYSISHNRELLFRAGSLEEAEERISEWIEGAETPEDADSKFARAIDTEEVRRHEIAHVTCLKDWAHLTGAEYRVGEKIGNTKQSSGEEAIFDGSSRWGRGAYVALASVSGPDGDSYASIGVENGDHYTADRRLRSGRRGSSALEIRHPTVEYDGETIHIESARSNTDTSITITAETGNPTVNLYQQD